MDFPGTAWLANFSLSTRRSRGGSTKSNGCEMKPNNWTGTPKFYYDLLFEYPAARLGCVEVFGNDTIHGSTDLKG